MNSWTAFALVPESISKEAKPCLASCSVGIGVLALALGLGVAWILAGSIPRPLRSLGEAAHRRARGDIGARAPEAGSREQIEVARKFNEMADRLEALLESQRAFVADASPQLRTPLTGLRLRLEAAGVKTDDPAVAREVEAASWSQAPGRARRRPARARLLPSSPAAEETADLSGAARDALERWRRTADETRHEIALDETGEAVVRVARSCGR